MVPSSTCLAAHKRHHRCLVSLACSELQHKAQHLVHELNCRVAAASSRHALLLCVAHQCQLQCWGELTYTLLRNLHLPQCCHERFAGTGRCNEARARHTRHSCALSCCRGALRPPGAGLRCCVRAQRAAQAAHCLCLKHPSIRMEVLVAATGAIVQAAHLPTRKRGVSAEHRVRTCKPCQHAPTYT